MSTTANAILLDVAGHRQALDLDDETQLLPSFQANDRTRPDTIQSDYSPEFSVPATAKNHQLLGHAAASQPTQGAAYKRVPAVLTSGGVETLPLATLLIKGYAQGRYKLQLIGGNKRLVEALGDKTLADLDLSRFDHNWTPANILTGLPYAHWQQNGWGYLLSERGKPIDLQLVDPYTLYPSCAAWLVLYQIIADAGFTSNDLRNEPLFAALTIPAANPYTYSDDYRSARALKAGVTIEYDPTVPNRLPGIAHQTEFSAEKLPFDYLAPKPYRGPTAATYTNYRYTVSTLGYYNITGTVALRFGSRHDIPGFGEVSCKVLLYINGSPVHDAQGNQIAKEELRNSNFDYQTHTFTPKLERWLLKPGDTVELFWQGDEWKNGVTSAGPLDPFWLVGIGRDVAYTQLTPTRALLNQSSFAVELLPDFPPNGLVKLNEWLPDMKQLDFLKSIMLTLGLTIQTDAYTSHLRFSPGNRPLWHTREALNWTAKRDAATVRGRPPERNLAYRLGDYGQFNFLKWKEDENVKNGYGDGEIKILDEVLRPTYEMAVLPFAATEVSTAAPGLLKILNFGAQDLSTKPIAYSTIKAEPRLTLRASGPDITGQLIMEPATDNTAAVLAGFITTADYFDGPDLSLELNKTVLTEYWQDLRACLDETRVLTERFRLTAQDIVELDYSRPIWLEDFGDYFLLSKVSEFDARRSTEIVLIRLNNKHLPPPPIPPGGLREWSALEWYAGEWW